MKGPWCWCLNDFDSSAVSPPSCAVWCFHVLRIKKIITFLQLKLYSRASVPECYQKKKTTSLFATKCLKDWVSPAVFHASVEVNVSGLYQYSTRKTVFSVLSPKTERALVTMDKKNELNIPTGPLVSSQAVLLMKKNRQKLEKKDQFLMLFLVTSCKCFAYKFCDKIR